MRLGASRGGWWLGRQGRWVVSGGWAKEGVPGGECQMADTGRSVRALFEGRATLPGLGFRVGL